MKSKSQRVRLVVAAVIIGVAFSACNSATMATTAPSAAHAAQMNTLSRG